jgi:nucleoside triphosphate pyrophosphatase
MRLVLASASPRRAELLTSAGFTFETLAVDADERPRPGEAPSAYVRRLAGEKSARALDLLSRSSRTGAGPPGGPPELQRGRNRNAEAEGAYYLQGPPEGGHYVRAEARFAREGGSWTVAEPDIVVLGADTAVVLDGEILGKPRDDEDARAMLRRLSGQRHEVLTGMSLRTVGDEMGLVEATSVWFAPLTPDAIAWYVSTGEGRDKAGAYAIQGFASRFISRIEGSYSNVVGLPVAAVGNLLQELRGGRPG